MQGELFQEKKVKSVKELSNELKNTLEETFAYIWVKGEVGSLKVHSSGHTYFSLKEEDYVINAIAWRGTPLSCQLEEGIIVECYGKITIYPGRSSYQIIVKEAKNLSSQGNIFFQLEELKKKLTAEGLFEKSRKKELNLLPNSIAILTSPTGAVFHDMMHRIKDRLPFVKIYFFPIPVQGLDSKKQILNALERAENFDVDTIILARGGGSLEDLWVFNDEEITRKVANLKKPIISAIGHETDFTLVDFAADLRAPTPTAAIELCVNDKIELKSWINNQINNSLEFFLNKFNSNKKEFNAMQDYKFVYRNALANFGQKIDNLMLNFIFNAKNRTNVENFSIESCKISLKKSFMEIENIANTTCSLGLIRFNQIKENIKEQSKYLEEKEADLSKKVMIKLDENDKPIFSKDLLGKENIKFNVQFLDGQIKAITTKG